MKGFLGLSIDFSVICAKKILYHKQLGRKEDGVLGKIVRQLRVMTGMQKMSGKIQN